MTDLRKAAEMALEALEKLRFANAPFLDEAMEALRQALAQPEQEPVGYVTDSGASAYFLKGVDLDDDTPLYTAPPKQPEQRPVGTYEGVMEAMLSLRNGTLEQQQVYGHMKDKLLYAAPPHHVNDVKKHEWVGLTDEDEEQCRIDADASYRRHMSSIRGQMISPADNYDWHLIRAVLAKAKEKNA
jgi:hypothetical protein